MLRPKVREISTSWAPPTHWNERQLETGWELCCSLQKAWPLQVPPKSHWDLDTRNQGVNKRFLGALGRGWKQENCLSLTRLRCKEALFYCMHLPNKQLNYQDQWFQFSSTSLQGGHVWIPLHLSTTTPLFSLARKQQSQWILRCKDRCAAIKNSSFSVKQN